MFLRASARKFRQSARISHISSMFMCVCKRDVKATIATEALSAQLHATAKVFSMCVVASSSHALCKSAEKTLNKKFIVGILVRLYLYTPLLIHAVVVFVVVVLFVLARMPQPINCAKHILMDDDHEYVFICTYSSSQCLSS